VRAVTIEPVKNLPLSAIAGVFFGTFGSFWLLLEPLSSLCLLPAIPEKYGWTLYGMLALISLAAVFIFVPIYRNLASARKTYFTFTVNSASDGAEHLVRSPSGMMVGDFLDLFVSYLDRGPAGARVAALRRTHDPTLQLVTPSGLVDISNSLTLSDAGISSGVRCQIAAHPREPIVLFSTIRARDGAEP
jgi:hypothetical protein